MAGGCGDRWHGEQRDAHRVRGGQGLAVSADQAMPLYIRDKVANTTAEREALKAQAALAKAAVQP